MRKELVQRRHAFGNPPPPDFVESLNCFGRSSRRQGRFAEFEQKAGWTGFEVERSKPGECLLPVTPSGIQLAQGNFGLREPSSRSSDRRLQKVLRPRGLACGA